MLSPRRRLSVLNASVDGDDDVEDADDGDLAVSPMMVTSLSRLFNSDRTLKLASDLRVLPSCAEQGEGGGESESNAIGLHRDEVLVVCP